MNYKWNFPVLGVIYAQDGLTNVIETVNWTLAASDGKYAASCYGSVNLDAPSPASFTPYENVTQDQVMEWTLEKLGDAQIASFKDSLTSQIQAQKKPPGGNLPPPWASEQNDDDTV